MIKPGYRTSEFWFTLVSFLFSGLYLIGVLDDHSQKEDLIAETSRGLEATILIIGQLTVLCRYIKGRVEIKKSARDSFVTEEEKPKINKRVSQPTKKSKKKPTKKSSNTI